MSLQRCAYFFIPLLLIIGCSSNQLKTQINSPQIKGNAVDSRTFMKVDQQQEWEADIRDLTNITVITKEGLEIPCNVERFKEKFRKYPQWVVGEKSNADFDFTVLFRLKSNQPKVLSVARDSVLWENGFYTGEGAIQMISFFKESLGMGFLQQLKDEPFQLISKDLEFSRRVTGGSAKTVVEMLKKATFIPGHPRLEYPLFPYYVLEFDRGGKGGEMVQAEILSPTLITVKLGQQKLYFQTPDSLYSPLKDQVPLVDFTDQNLKYLFKSSDMQIMMDGGSGSTAKYVLDREKINDFEAQSIIHNIVRKLLQGKKVDDLNTHNESEGITLILFIGDSHIPVHVYNDSFVYQRNLYLKPGILKEIKEYFKGVENLKQIP